jgi:hypothetical protein
MKFFSAVSIAIFMHSGFAIAQEAPPPVNVRNAGAFQCGEFLPVIREQGRQVEKTAFLNWTAAYSTAVARSNRLIDVFPIGDTWELLIMVSLVCTENDEVTFEAALRTTMLRLQPFWIRSSPEVLTLTDPGGRTVLYYAEATEPLQTSLNRYGNEINVDGAYGNQTGNTIRILNESRGTQSWMTPDGELLYELTRP